MVVEIIPNWLHFIFFSQKKGKVILSSFANTWAFVYICINARQIKIAALSVIVFYMKNCKTQEKNAGQQILLLFLVKLTDFIYQPDLPA